jgi:hypothetical protein
MVKRKKVEWLASTEATLRALLTADLVQITASVSRGKTRVQNVSAALRSLATKVEKRVAAESSTDAALGGKQ